MRKGFIYIVLILLMIVLLGSCRKTFNYPPQPVIDFQYLTVKDTVENNELGNKVVLYQLVFKVLDGDNNLGLGDDDTTGVFSTNSEYHNNLFIAILNKVNGRFDTVHLPLSLSYRIPKANVVNIYNYFKATIMVDLTFDPVVLQEMLDTFKFSFYVLDRDLNRSNIQQTPALTVQFRGTVQDTVTIIQ